MDFRPGDDYSIEDHSTVGRSTTGNGVIVFGEVRDFHDLVSEFAPETTNTELLVNSRRAQLSECGLSEDDFSHAVDDIFEPTLSIWQNN